MLEKLQITHPKQKKSARTGFESFYPYYAGYPQSFADQLLASAELSPNSIVLDPWNGSGTTTKAAAQLGIGSIGCDINPVMVMISTARLLPRSEASCLVPLIRELIGRSARIRTSVIHEPLQQWLSESTARCIRSIERAIAAVLMPADQDPAKEELGTSRLVASLYLALFATTRELTKSFRSTNPTWIRKAKSENEKLDIPPSTVHAVLLSQAERLANAYLAEAGSDDANYFVSLRVADSTASTLKNAVDFVLTSPPYCTRIDYAVATSVELAILNPYVNIDTFALSKRMLGTPKVSEPLRETETLGRECDEFLNSVRKHESKASSTYYYKTHFDYYQKINCSLRNINTALKENGSAILVVQDSYYKNIHNNVPAIITELAKLNGLNLVRREDFLVKKNMVSMNPRANSQTTGKATESVLCFSKS